MKYITEEGRKYFNEAITRRDEEGVISKVVGAAANLTKAALNKKRQVGANVGEWLDDKGRKKAAKKRARARFGSRLTHPVILGKDGKPKLDRHGKPLRDTSKTKRSATAAKAVKGLGVDVADTIVKGHEAPISQALGGDLQAQGYKVGASHSKKKKKKEEDEVDISKLHGSSPLVPKGPKGQGKDGTTLVLPQKADQDAHDEDEARGLPRHTLRLVKGPDDNSEGS